MKSYSVDKLRFYDGRTHSIDNERLYQFESRALTDRFYSGRNVDVTSVLEELGPACILYTNVQPWADEIPDIDPRSARIFTLWAEDNQTHDITVILRGFFLLPPFEWGKSTIKSYYYLTEDRPYYPIAVISAFLTVFQDETIMIELFDRIKEEIQTHWQTTRQRVIDTLDQSSDLWKRYVLSFEQIIHFSFLCSGFDRELMNALVRNDYRITGVLQMLASPTASYDQAMVETHLNEAKKVIEEAEKKRTKS